LDDPAALFFDADARALLRQRLRYVVARWGYSPNIMAWKLWTRSTPGGLHADPCPAWLQELVNTLRQLDPYDHLVTTGARETNAELSHCTLDFTQVVYYPGDQVAASVDEVAAVFSLISRTFAQTTTRAAH